MNNDYVGKVPTLVTLMLSEVVAKIRAVKKSRHESLGL